MKITILCSDALHPVNSYLKNWSEYRDDLRVRIINDTSQINDSGDILFLISCHEKVKENIIEKFRYSLVMHASDVPAGRGWSPHVWEILNGTSNIVLSLLDVGDEIDTGAVWKKVKIPIGEYELYDEVNHKLFEAQVEMLDWACENIVSSVPEEQSKNGVSYYRRREPSDSELDINKSIKSQFNLLRICDKDRFPAFINIGGHRFNLYLSRRDSIE